MPRAAYKRCTKCGETKPLDDFHREKLGAQGRRSKCKACYAAAHRRSARYQEAEARRRALAERSAKRCPRCGTIRPIEDFPLASDRVDGHGPYCKPCERARSREKYKADPGAAAARHRRWEKVNRDRMNELHRLRYRRDRHKVAARNAINNAVNRGRLIPPDKCERCALPGSVEAHHDDYSRPFDVEWLCRDCHGIADREVWGDAESLRAALGQIAHG